MKKIFTFFAAMVAVVAMNAQSVDYALEGFIDEENNLITEINLGLNDDLNPTVVLTNNGPDVPAAGDTIFMDITLEGQLLGSSYLLGSQLAVLPAGQSIGVGGQQPLLTASQMSEAGIEGSFEFCYTLRIVGQATDPDASNNTACVTISRGNVGIENIAEGEINVYPNPANSVINVANAEGSQVSVYDMSGRMVANVQSASANEVIDATSFAQGLYIVRIVDGQNVTTKKVSVAR